MSAHKEEITKTKVDIYEKYDHVYEMDVDDLQENLVCRLAEVDDLKEQKDALVGACKQSLHFCNSKVPAWKPEGLIKAIKSALKLAGEEE